MAIRANRRTDVALNDVVSEDDAYWIAAGKVFYQRKGFRNAALTFLVSVVKMFETKRLAISQKAQKVSCGVTTSNYHYVSDPRIH